MGEARKPQMGLTVEVFDKAQLIQHGLRRPARRQRRQRRAAPDDQADLPARSGEPTGHLSLVGKGIMYDSGGISLKPGDEVARPDEERHDRRRRPSWRPWRELAELGCPTAVTGYLMCTDNMPSGTALALGDVITMRGGTTVEVINTDAEGRLVMADALVLATEEPTDAIVYIATLTGACMRALGTEVAGVIGTDQGLVDQVAAAGRRHRRAGVAAAAGRAVPQGARLDRSPT